MASLTPMMQQYMQLKQKYNDCLLFFRLGDFYEMFFDDAELASKELEIALTGRDCGLKERAPMCGVPYHSVDTYINKLIERGYKVAICEQLSDPSQSKGIVERDIIRVITPGTVIESTMLTENENNFIASLYKKADAVLLAYCDVSTGEFYTMAFGGDETYTNLYGELERIEPREVVISESINANEIFAQHLKRKYCVQELASRYFDARLNQERLLRHFEVVTLAGFGLTDGSAEVSAAGALLCYLDETQKNSLKHINKIIPICRSEYMSLDAVTRRNLELTQPLRFNGNKRSTLLYVLDKTSTAMGGRMLRKWIEQPLQLRNQIEERLNSVEIFVKSAKERERIAGLLGKMYDMERLCSRITYGTVSPRDCDALRRSLSILPETINYVKSLKAETLRHVATGLDPMDDIYKLLQNAIADNPPVSAKDPGVIKKGYNKEIDALRDLSHNAKKWLSDFEAAEKERTGIKYLKVGYNRVFGYFIEVSKSNASNVPLEYQRKQTLANSERYITPLLKETEERILTANEKCAFIEYNLFCEVREALAACIERLQKNAALIAQLDVYTALARVAVANNYCKPALNTKGKLAISDGRHPVVEYGAKEAYVANSTDMNTVSDRLHIITGPNMAGKSTYMRQVALITLMAHIGSFVPARAANICITDKIFTRIGASDSLVTGQSTFMVEMSEMANILNNATKHSLLILDEIGRGTSTFDGLSIAWSVLEYVANEQTCGAKAMFATHYQELTELEGKLEGVKNYRITVAEAGDNIIFLRKVVRGGSDKSFGIQVAQLAGLPSTLIERAKVILRELEESEIQSAAQKVPPVVKNTQASLFGEGTGQCANEIINELCEVDANRMSPIDALGKLYELSARARMLK